MHWPDGEHHHELHACWVRRTERESEKDNWRRSTGVLRNRDALWLQLGIRHDAALERARAAGMLVVQDKCLKVEHAMRA